jgi:hypothetical protein
MFTKFKYQDAPKNFKIVDGVADSIGSDHKPFHLLCKSHTWERLDSDILAALSKMESKIGLKERMIASEPRLRQFISQSKCVTNSSGSYCVF